MFAIMKFIFSFVVLLFSGIANCQLLTWSPNFIQEESSPVEITVDATKGNQGLLDYLPTNVYVHIGVITTSSTSSSDWKYSKFTWGTTPVSGQATSNSTNKFTYTINGGLRTFFGLSNPSEKIIKIAILFRSGDGNRVQRNADGGDMYIPVYDNGLNVRITNPPTQPKFYAVPEDINKTLGDPLPVTGVSSLESNLKIFLNNTQVGATATNSTSISETATITSYGQQVLVVEATMGLNVKSDTIKFFVTPVVNTAALPAGVKDGVNYDPNNTSVTLVLYAPFKTRVSVLGDFNNWTETVNNQMNRTPDGLRYWIRIDGLTPQTEYAYQFLIDGNLKVADYTTEKVLDPNNDSYIPTANYPNLKPYPFGKTTGIVSVLQTAKPAYTWQVPNFVKPDKRNLVIYELLVRDFVATQRFSTIKDSISYLKKLGVNAIEVMPFNEFEGNNSWGYNPDFYFAPDKMYGTENDLRAFVDECHKQGIAVIMDIALNHAFGLSPTVQMYWDALNNRPAANNPWHNVIEKHPYNVGFDFNHESAATKNLVDMVIEHWLTKYKIDGFRWDLSKGFTQKNTLGNEAAFAAYDDTRIAIWKRIYDKMEAVAPNSYCILEHFADNIEEKELSDYGMLLWGNSNHDYNEATMGYNSNFEYGIFTTRGWSNPYLVTYQESHDEERLMFKNEQYGNQNGGYNIKNIPTGLKRNEMAASFWAMTPGPKMLWQFGELGYDYSINTCENLTIDNSCRTSPKPIKWDYLADENRKALNTVYSKLLTLRKVPDYLPTFVTSNITYDLGGNFKKLQVNSGALKITVVGNFGVVTETGNVTFQNNGTWYNYLQGGTRNATGLSESITLQPGEYYVYLDRDPTAMLNALPLKLLSFSGVRLSNNIALKWATVNEVNVHYYELQRSMDGVNFSKINNTTAINKQSQQPFYYSYNDKDLSAVNADTKIYYRLKMVDNDGVFTYSSVALINPLVSKTNILLYPNPVIGSQVYVSFDNAITTPTSISVTDITGRVYAKYTVSRSDYNNGFLPINVNTYSNGAYLIKIESKAATTLKQFIISR